MEKWHFCFVNLSSEAKQALYFHLGTWLIIIIWWYFSKLFHYCCVTNYHKRRWLRKTTIYLTHYWQIGLSNASSLTWAYSRVCSQLPCSQRKAALGWPELGWPVSIPCSPSSSSRAQVCSYVEGSSPRGRAETRPSVAQAGMGEKLVPEFREWNHLAKRTPSLKSFYPAGSCTMGLWREG